MKAKDTSLLTFMRNATQSIIPIYQRTYSWQREQCEQLWNDILNAGAREEGHIHFIGSVVYIERDQSQVSNQSPLMVIDGQQRLTTASLLLEALARHVGDKAPMEGFDQNKIRGYYLRNPLESGERQFKLLLTQTDKDTLIALFSGAPEPARASVRVRENFNWFAQELKKVDSAQVCRGLNKLMIVDVALTRGQDNPQLIFESLNSTGKELSQADLIRNYILMGLEQGLQTRLYQQYWRPMEEAFGQVAYNEHFDSFMRHYLTVRTGEIPREAEVYKAFKAWSKDKAAGDTEALLRDVLELAKHYCVIALNATADKELMRALHDLRELRVDVSYPFLLELFDDHAKGLLPLEDLIAAIRITESYVFRRAVCMVPTNSLNKTFARFTATLDKSRYLESIKAHYLLLTSYRRFPSDEEFERDIQLRDLYNFRSRSYWLRRFENHDRKEVVQIEGLTIEHVMPQNENAPGWHAELGDEWKRIHSTYLHTLGNLTLTAYNPELSDNPFREKRDMKGGFKDSPIRLNHDLAALDHWNEQTIRNRAVTLASKAVKVWESPKLDAAILQSHAPKKDGAKYTLENHSQLDSAAQRELFEALRKEILALDPNVTMEVLKLYIAFKAETNFVDIVPKTKGLVLSLNVAFGEIQDPEGRCEDVTDKGRWGNGDVRMMVSSKEDIPYAMGLVRQSLEKQLGQPA